MPTPSKKLVDSERNRVDNLKAKFERSFKSKFHAWQVKVFAEFMAQIDKGVTTPKLSPILKEELTSLLIGHYHAVAMVFIPGLIYPVEQGQAREVSTSDSFDWLMPSLFTSIIKGLDAQISLNLPIHLRSIIQTTELIGAQAVAIARIEQANVRTILGNKLAARETTVAITETDWIAEASTNTALEVTTPATAIADKGQMEEIQKISPNTTLKEADLDKEFEDAFLLLAFTRTLSNPQKMWITMGDKKVRATHRRINLTQVAALEPFILSGGLLMFPADSSLGVAFGEIVNCRCFALYF